MGSTTLPLRGTLKLAKAKVTTDAQGAGTILLKVPGTVGKEATRIIQSGMGWFEVPHVDDEFTIYVSDEDNILGYGAGTVVDGYTDTEIPAANQGWYFPSPQPLISVEALGDLGRLMGGLYLKVVVQKGTATVDTFRMNIKWGIE